MHTADITPTPAPGSQSCTVLDRLVERIQDRVDTLGKGSVFTTDADLQGTHLNTSIDNLHRAVSRANVTGVFVSSSTELGTRVTPDRVRGFDWRHFAVKNPNPRTTELHRTDDQIAAAKREEMDMLKRGLAEFSLDTLQQAATMLAGGALPRAEKHRDLAAWLVKLRLKLDATLNEKHRKNLLWLHAARAPTGWCHVRSGMIGTLLEDIVAGLTFEVIRRRYAEKMGGLNHLRPKAAPAAGNLAQAEKLVSALGIADSLPRRFATLGDLIGGVPLGSPRCW